MVVAVQTLEGEAAIYGLRQQEVAAAYLRSGIVDRQPAAGNPQVLRNLPHHDLQARQIERLGIAPDRTFVAHNRLALWNDYGVLTAFPRNPIGEVMHLTAVEIFDPVINELSCAAQKDGAQKDAEFSRAEGTRGSDVLNWPVREHSGTRPGKKLLVADHGPLQADPIRHLRLPGFEDALGAVHGHRTRVIRKPVDIFADDGSDALEQRH